MATNQTPDTSLSGLEDCWRKRARCSIIREAIPKVNCHARPGFVDRFLRT